VIEEGLEPAPAVKAAFPVDNEMHNLTNFLAVAGERGASIKTSDAAVVMATYDQKRWPLLAAAVESVLADPGQPRQLVICVDQDKELFNQIQATWPDITAVLNTRERGASVTRNTGAEFAETPFIAFLDDDIRVHEGWLAGLLEPFTDRDVVGTGGGVLPAWQAGRPGWFPAEFDWVVGASFRGMPTVQSTVRNVWAESMAVRTDVFRAVSGFRTDFGKVGLRNSPEDTDLCIRMAASSAGARWVYAPEALAEHHVPTARATFSYFLRRTYLEGKGKVEMAQLLGRQEKLQNERDYVRKTLPSGITAGLWAAARHGQVDGILKAGAIAAGVLAAGVGAVAGRCSLSAIRRQRNRKNFTPN
jgi:glucosyl-dolichyl phosphate glucuronosyltransferase